jgi:hypothetical protein
LLPVSVNPSEWLKPRVSVRNLDNLVDGIRIEPHFAVLRVKARKLQNYTTETVIASASR